MESFTNESRSIDFHPVEPRAFIGRWSEATSSFETLRPRITLQSVSAPLATPTVSSVACDVIIAVSALLMIFCIPFAVVLLSMSR